MVQESTVPCPLCGRTKRAHSRITLEDIGADGTAKHTGYTAIICRDCAFATVVRAQAGTGQKSATAPAATVVM